MSREVTKIKLNNTNYQGIVAFLGSSPRFLFNKGFDLYFESYYGPEQTLMQLTFIIITYKENIYIPDDYHFLCEVDDKDAHEDEIKLVYCKINTKNVL